MSKIEIAFRTIKTSAVEKTMEIVEYKTFDKVHTRITESGALQVIRYTNPTEDSVLATFNPNSWIYSELLDP